MKTNLPAVILKEPQSPAFCKGDVTRSGRSEWIERSYKLKELNFDDYNRVRLYMNDQNPVTDDYIITKFNYCVSNGTAEITDRTRISHCG